MEGVVKKLGSLAEKISEILGQSLGIKSNYFKERCEKGKSSFRMNRYPPCPIASQVYGLIPHTDTDYLTILYQPQISGLQLKKSAKWFPVKPNPRALLLNIGDLFQVPPPNTFSLFSFFFFSILKMFESIYPCLRITQLILQHLSVKNTCRILNHR